MNQVEIEIGGKKRGFRFGLRFISELLKHYDASWPEVGALLEKNPFDLIPTVLYYAAKDNDRGKEIDYDIEKFIDWIEELPNGFKDEKVNYVYVYFMEALTDHVGGLKELLKEKGYDIDDAKKKLIGNET